MRHEWEEKQKKANVALSKSPKGSARGKLVFRSELDYRKQKSLTASTAREEDEYIRWLKQQENIGYGLTKRLEEKRVAAGVELSTKSENDLERNLFKNKQLETKKNVENIDQQSAGLSD